MRPPEVGQVLVTRSGEEIHITEVTLESELGEPDFDPDGYFVGFVYGAAAVTDMSAPEFSLSREEFEELCKNEGISY